MESEASQFCTFYVGKYFLGIEIMNVQEVLRKQNISYVPLSPKKIRGLINLRGEIITAVDMWTHLNLEKDTDKETNIIIKSTGGLTSLIVEDIGEIISVDKDKLQPVPAHLKSSFKELFTAVCQVKSEILLLINLNKI